MMMNAAVLNVICPGLVGYRDIRGHDARIALVVLESSNAHEPRTRLELMLLYIPVSLIESHLDE